MDKQLLKFEDHILLDFEGIKMDYRIQFDITGRIYNFHPLFFDLPANAQKIIFGNKVRTIKKKLINYGNLLQLILPLGINFQSTFFEEEFCSIYQQINFELNRLNIEVSNLHQISVESSLPFLINSICSSEKMLIEKNKTLIAYFDILMMVLRKPNGKKESSLISNLGIVYPYFGIKLIPLIIPILNDSIARKSAYSSLHFNKEKECFDYLLQELLIVEDEKEIAGILTALSTQEFKNPLLKEKLVSIFYSNLKLDDFAKKSLIATLKNYPSIQTEEIAIKLAKGDESFSCKEAVKTLIYLNYSPKLIIKIIFKKFESKDPKDLKLAYGQLASSHLLSKHLPNCFDLIDQYKESIESSPFVGVGGSFSKVLEYKLKVQMFNKKKVANYIFSFINDCNPKVTYSFLTLIDCLLDFKKTFKNLINSKTKYQILYKHINSENRKIRLSAIQVLSKIGRIKKDSQVLNTLIEKAIQSIQLETLNPEIMKAINTILPSVKYDSRLDNILVTIIENMDSSLLHLALITMRYSNNNKLKESYYYLKDDQNGLVQIEARKLLTNADYD